MPMMLDWKIEETGCLDPELRAEMSQLWHDDPFSSPFSAPSFLEMMVQKVVEKKETPLFAKGYDRSGNLAALWPLRLDRSGCLCFLQFYLTDYNTALFLPWVKTDMLSQGLARAVQQLRPKTVFLNNMPEWGRTREAAVEGLGQAGYRCVPVAYDKVPCVQGAMDSEGKKRFGRQFNRHRGLKNYSNRLKKMKGFHFEVDETRDDIDEWVDQFCVAHDKRWETTSTPSKYQDEKTRTDLKDALKAWARDRVLVRFSIHVLNQRITFVAGLKKNKGRGLIYFHTARLPVYDKLSTGNITIRLMGLWMMENGYACMDFGRGNEAYKHIFANETRDLWRIYGARSPVSLHYWKGCVEAYVKAKESRRQLWAMLDRHVFKSRWMKVFRRESNG
jgi:CelD/BcsL family acetyltransferase involved in cellulose biosynthesis